MTEAEDESFSLRYARMLVEDARISGMCNLLPERVILTLKLLSHFDLS